MKIACAGGGTGGHIFPGIAVIEEIKKKNASADIVWLGSGRKLEREILARFDIPYYAVPSGKLRRYFSLQNLWDIFRVAAGIPVSFFLLKRLRVDILFSKGGYVAVAPVIAARLLGIPVVTHESDRDPGLATRIAARFADAVLLAYRQSRDEHFREGPFRGTGKEALVTGNPVRSELLLGSSTEGRRMIGVKGDKPVVVVLGGSQGAAQINRLISAILERILPYAVVVHQMGAAGYTPSSRDGYITAAFYNEEFPHILAAADLVISRAGAGTLWESGVMGKPSILVPLGSASSRGDQVRNAGLFVEEGAAVALTGDDVTPERLVFHTLRLLRDDTLRRDMAEKAKNLCVSNSAERIAEILLSKVPKSVKREVNRG